MKEKLAELLLDAKNQIEYLHEKFKPTGSGNAIIARIESELSELEAKEASIGGDEVKKGFECYEILQVRAGNRFNCSEQCDECKEEERLLNSPLTKEGGETDKIK